jgi:hypothetical protein
MFRVGLAGLRKAGFGNVTASSADCCALSFAAGRLK